MCMSKFGSTAWPPTRTGWSRGVVFGAMGALIVSVIPYVGVYPDESYMIASVGHASSTLSSMLIGTEIGLFFLLVLISVYRLHGSKQGTSDHASVAAWTHLVTLLVFWTLFVMERLYKFHILDVGRGLTPHITDPGNGTEWMYDQPSPGSMQITQLVVSSLLCGVFWYGWI